MKKVGILTHYFNSKNYGGVLQAYGLEKVINKLNGFSAEQICYEIATIRYGENTIHDKPNLIKFLNPLKYYSTIKKEVCKVFVEKKIQTRRLFFSEFRAQIIHSAEKYDINNIAECNDKYDVFITGSDQVWNLDWFTPTFFLDFAAKNKKRISYAASIGHSNLNEDRKEYFKRVLPTFDSISVREKDSVDLLQSLTDKKIEWVLDPTLLLDVNDWDEICSARRIEEKYLFCYFLGHDKSIRKLAKKYAKKHKLTIVNLPHLVGFCNADVGFGQHKLYDVGPNDFISLIKYSECVFTDSFHACVFSGIYNKDFYVFNRKGLKNASSRLYSLCELFECQDHFCDIDDKFSLNYLDSLSPINYNKEFKLLHEMKEKSIQFLQDALNNE